MLRSRGFSEDEIRQRISALRAKRAKKAKPRSRGQKRTYAARLGSMPPSPQRRR